jgi:5-methylcytosine-specific restriction endonuclease McrA
MLKKVKRIKLGKEAYRRLMRRVLDRDGWRCQKCGSLEHLQIHHKLERSAQGNDAVANLITLCAHCHLGQHGQLVYSSSAVNQQAKSEHITSLAGKAKLNDSACRQ